MTAEQHKNEVEKLDSLEAELSDLIVEIGNQPLIDKFLDWVNQRNKCNQGYLAYLEEILKTKI